MTEATRHDIIRLQSALIEYFDDDIDVKIRNDRCLQIVSERVKTLDFVISIKKPQQDYLLMEVAMGTSKVKPSQTTVTVKQLVERVLQWRETQDLAAKRQSAAKSGKTR